MDKNEAGSREPGAQADPYFLDRRDRRNRSHFGRRPSRRERERERLVRDFFGEEESRGLLRDHQRPAQSMRETVDDVLISLGMRREVLLEDLTEAWPELFGPDIAGKSAPCRVVGSRLDIEVDNPSWLYVLQTVHRREILNRVRKHTRGKITGIRFVPAGRHERRGGDG